jgi:hypothetical protein
MCAAEHARTGTDRSARTARPKTPQLTICLRRSSYVPSDDDLVRRPPEAQTHAEEVMAHARRVLDFSRILRSARKGEVSICRCAWCDRFKIGNEWLHLDAIGRGQQHIRDSLLRRASHGICPECFDEQLQLRNHAPLPRPG